MALVVRTITTLEALAGLREEWVGLLERAGGGNEVPFLSPEWQLCWWEAFQQRGPLIRDSLRVRVVRDDAGTLVGIVPLMLTERPCFGPMRAATLGFLGVDRFVTEQQGPIVDRSCESAVALAVARELLAEDGWDWIAWHGLDRESEFARALESAMPLRWGSGEPGNIVTLAPTWDDFRHNLKRNIKESLRRCYNSLKRDGLTARLEVAETAADIERDLPTFFSLHAMRAQQDSGVPHPDRFSSGSLRRFLSAVCGRLAERRVTRVFTLMIGQVPVASRVAFRLKDTLYLYYSGADPAWSQYSVATTLVAEAIKYAIGQQIPRLHLSMGADVSKARWGPEMPVKHQAVSLRARTSSRAAFELYSLARRSTLLEGGVGRILPKRRFDGV